MRIQLFGGGKEKAEKAKDTGADAGAALAVSGDLRVAGNASFPDGLIVHGNLTVEPDARLEGDVRVAGFLIMGAGAQITGSAVVQGKAVLAADASIGGRLSCQKLLLRAGRAPVKQAKAEAEIIDARPA